MTPGVTIWRCAKCGSGFFPEPLLRVRCHHDKFDTGRAHEAVVEEISIIRHMLGQENWQPRRIANVCTSDGQRMTVGLRDESREGDTIELFEEGTAPYGRAKAK